jgi:hypothetical protein
MKGMPAEERMPYFKAKAKDFIERYRIRQDRNRDSLSSLRIGYLFQSIFIKTHGLNVNQDSLIWFRDWAWDNKINCDEIVEKERKKNGDKKKNPYFNPSHRLFPELTFKRYAQIVEDIIMPKRQPLTKRTPIVRIDD